MKGLDTLFFLQSILTLIVQTIVSAVLGAFSNQQQQGALKVSLRAFSIKVKEDVVCVLDSQKGGTTQ